MAIRRAFIVVSFGWDEFDYDVQERSLATRVDTQAKRQLIAGTASRFAGSVLFP
jgi:hypothetical protein